MILRAVKSSSDRMNPGWWKSWAVGGSRRFVLECGHEVVAKQSSGRPNRKRCRDCERGVVGDVERAALARALAHAEAAALGFAVGVSIGRRR